MSAGDSRLEEAARRVAEQLPPLTDEQRVRIAALLAPVLDMRGSSGKMSPRRRRAPRPDIEGRHTSTSADTPTPPESTAARFAEDVAERVTP